MVQKTHLPCLGGVLDALSKLERDLRPRNQPISFSGCLDLAPCHRYDVPVDLIKWVFSVSGALPRAHDARPCELFGERGLIGADRDLRPILVALAFFLPCVRCARLMGCVGVSCARLLQKLILEGGSKGGTFWNPAHNLFFAYPRAPGKL